MWCGATAGCVTALHVTGRVYGGAGERDSDHESRLGPACSPGAQIAEEADMAAGRGDDAVAGGVAGCAEAPKGASGVSTGRPRARSMSMHDGIAVWCDCCSCEAEPYWVEIAAEMGIDPGSDYEDDESGA